MSHYYPAAELQVLSAWMLSNLVCGSGAPRSPTTRLDEFAALDIACRESGPSIRENNKHVSNLAAVAKRCDF
jgi:hypothetical protein